MKNTSNVIHENLIKHYDYGKQWTVYASLDPCVGKQKNNVVVFNIEPVTFLIYFSNPLVRPVSTPFEDIKIELASTDVNFFEMARFWNHLCPYPWQKKNKLSKNFYKKLKNENYCKNRNLCAVCTERNIGYSTDNNVDISLFAPCVGRSFIPVLMGPVNGQEEKYPLDDIFEKEYPLKLLNNLTIKINDLKKKHEHEIEKVTQLSKLAEEVSLEDF